MSQLIIAQQNDVLIADFLETNIIDRYTVDSVAEELQTLPDRASGSTVLVDMNRVESSSSELIGEFIKLSDRCDHKTIKLKLCNLSPELRERLRATHLDGMFEIYPTRRTALDTRRTNKSQRTIV